MAKNDKRKKTDNSWLNFLDTVTSIIIVPILVISIICSVIMINAKRSNNVPNIFGFSLVTVLSESMVNSGFEIDDSVMVKRTDPDDIKIGDIIAYYKYIENTNDDLSDVARAEENNSASAEELNGVPESSKVSSWKLYMSKIFSNITYTSTEASEKAIKANSSIIFHQVVDIIEYDGYKWFRTWGTSNLYTDGEPNYDPYWIREDYIIGRYTHTSSAVRSFLSFASTNSGILWMVEVPSGVHLVLSTLELVEILDMMTRDRHERIKNGTYIDRKEYKRMLRAKRKMLASGNIDLESFKRMFPNYDNFDIVYSETENNKHNVNINGPPDLNGDAENKHKLYGNEATLDVGDSPPKGRAPNERDGPPGDLGESPPNGTRGSTDESPPNARGKPSARGDTGDESPPNARGKPLARGDTGDESPPKARGDTSVGSSQTAESNVSQANKVTPKLDKSLYAVSTDGLYDAEDRVQETKDLELVQKSLNNQKTKLKLAENEVVLTEKDLSTLTDIYPWINADFVADTNLTNKGVVSKPNKNNRIYLVSKKTKRQFSLASLGKILSVNNGLITTEDGIYKYILTNAGVRFEKLVIDPKFTVISAKQDIFGNVFVGVSGGDNTEVTYKTSDGKLVSIWNRNALLTLGNNYKLYYISMDKSYDLNKGVITDLKVMNKDGKLVSANSDNIKSNILFIDGFDKYGFLYLTPNALVLQLGRMVFVLKSKKTIKLNKDQWIAKNGDSVIHHNKAKNVLKRYELDEFIRVVEDVGDSIDDDTGGVVLAEDVKRLTVKDGQIDADVGKLLDDDSGGGTSVKNKGSTPETDSKTDTDVGDNKRLKLDIYS